MKKLVPAKVKTYGKAITIILSKKSKPGDGTHGKGDKGIFED